MNTKAKYKDKEDDRQWERTRRWDNGGWRSVLDTTYLYGVLFILQKFWDWWSEAGFSCEGQDKHLESNQRVCVGVGVGVGVWGVYTVYVLWNIRLPVERWQVETNETICFWLFSQQQSGEECVCVLVLQIDPCCMKRISMKHNGKCLHVFSSSVQPHRNVRICKSNCLDHNNAQCTCSLIYVLGAISPQGKPLVKVCSEGSIAKNANSYVAKVWMQCELSWQLLTFLLLLLITINHFS